MRIRTMAIATTLLAAAGCSSRNVDSNLEAMNPYPIPQQVAALAAPGQDLSTATLVAEDDCYWYTREGQVERTFVPLRAANGNHICNARAT